MGEDKLLGLVSFLFSGIIGLLIYLWRQKDIDYNKLADKLDKILEGINQSNRELERMKKDNEMVIRENTYIRKEVDEIKDTQNKLVTNVEVLLEFKKNIDKNGTR